MGAESIAAVVAAIFRSSNLIAGWLFTYAVHSTLWIVAALAIVRIPGVRQRAAWQHVVWIGAMVAGVASSTLQLTGLVPSRPSVVHVADGIGSALGGIVIGERRRSGEPLQVRLGAVSRRDLAGLGREEITFDRRVSHVLPLSPRVGGEAQIARDVLVATETPSGGRRMFMALPDLPGVTTFSRTFVLAAPVSLAVVVPLFAIATILLVRLQNARAQLARVVASSRDGRYSTAGIALEELAARAGVSRPITLVVSDAVDSPATVSASRIILPRRMLAELTVGEQEAVLAHELAHVVRRDTLWLQLALIIERVAWFQPLNRLARRRMELAAEFAADHWAVALTRSPLQLARALAHVAAWFAAAPRVRLHAALGAAGSPLLQRVRSLTAPGGWSERTPSLTLAHAMVVSAALAIVMSLLPRVEVGRSVDAPARAHRVVRVEYRA